uniref:hypothetical protein n=1 Tax=Salmonella enterica TaxID=28901 RepID=UPI0020C501C4
KSLPHLGQFKIQNSKNWIPLRFLSLNGRWILESWYEKFFIYGLVEVIKTVPLDFNEIRQLLTTIAQPDIAEVTLKSDDFELTVRKAVGVNN